MKFENKYSLLDRTLHQIAFKTYPLQTAISDVEELVFKKQLSAITIEKPVFVTAIPRAGTTLLLELCVELDEFVSHTYREMPFVLTPMLWSRFSGGFRQSSAARERAHGDGMLVDTDSPEAFEEILWKVFWKKHYLKDRIVPWGDVGFDEFDDFLSNHMRKIIAIHSKQPELQARYISKNNLNVARIPMLRNIFPDAIILVPFREPIQHAASLLRQHLNFLEIHKHDHFAKDYMEAIGHYDFGENLKPVDFDGWIDGSSAENPTTIDFWLEYWIAAYKNILKSVGDNIYLISYESLCANPDSGFVNLAKILHVKDLDKFSEQATRIRSAKPHSVNIDQVENKLVDEARSLYNELSEVSFI